jgi:O-antigen/teichoic acid export membrane protein
VIESILKETGKDALRYVPAKVIPAAVNFAGLLVFTHILSPEDYGNYFIVLTTISVMTIIGSNWVANSVIRFYPEFKLKGDLDRFFSNVVFAFVICNWILLLLFILGFLVFEARIPPALTSMLTVGIFAYLSSAAYFVLLYFLRASQQASVFSVCEILSSVGRLGLALLLVFLLKTGAINLLWAMLVISTIISILISRRFSLGKRLKAGLFSSETCKDLAKFGLPLAVSSLSAWLLVLSDRYILDYFGSAEQVGIYSVSFSVVDRSIGMLYSILNLGGKGQADDPAAHPGAEPVLFHSLHPGLRWPLHLKQGRFHAVHGKGFHRKLQAGSLLRLLLASDGPVSILGQGL